MPFCDIDEDVSLHYTTNTATGDVTDLDHCKQTIIFLPGIFCAVDMWLREQFKDPRLSQHYNLIAFDLRNMGSTKAPLCPRRDGWVDAADLAIAHELLRLPPCHIFTVATNSGGAALRFAALFPEKCLSLCLCASPTQPGNDPEWVEEGNRETLAAWCFPQNLEDVERASMAFSWYGFTGQISWELEDEVVAWWQVNLPPTKRTVFLAQGLSAINRSRLSDEELDSIKQPTIIVQGDKSFISPPHKAMEIADKLPNSHLFVVQGGPELMNIMPQYASVINRVYTQFLENICDVTPEPKARPVQPNREQVCKAGLARLAKFADDPSIADRDPSTPLSFSRVSAALAEEVTAQFAAFSEGESEAFHALDEHGEPLRKFSERHIDEWTPDAFQRHYITPQDAMVMVSRTMTVT